VLCAIGGIVNVTSDTITSITDWSVDGGGEATARPVTTDWVKVGAFISTTRLKIASTPSPRFT
jgi:hypothetical protein